MKKYGKFAILIVVVVGTLVWLGFTGSKESQTYYKTVAEVCKGPEQVLGKRIRVGGDVVDGSIQHVGSTTQFVLMWEGQRLNVVYTGSDPLPDTFKSGAEALADGKLGADQVFRASKVQAKCASKYESKPGLAPGQPAPNINTGKS
jgi:cytochrome c-type biogenesis protein CcmE